MKRKRDTFFVWVEKLKAVVEMVLSPRVSSYRLLHLIDWFMNLTFLQDALAITPHYGNTMLIFLGMNEQMNGWPRLINSLLPCILMVILH